MSLVALADYRNLTGDSVTDESVVDPLLAVAQGLVELALGRVGLLELGTHIETLDVWGDLVYPTASPIDPATPGYVSASKFRVPAGASFVRYEDQGIGDWGRPWRAGATCPTRRAVVTYSGGYDLDTCPYPLKLAISRTAQSLVPGAGELATVPAGVKSLTVGDVSMAFARPTGTSLLPVSVLPLIEAYRPDGATRT